MRTTVAGGVAALLLTALAHAQPQNLCPNPGAELAAEQGPAGWLGSAGRSEWATDDVHSGERSLKIFSDEPSTVSWTSDMIPIADGQRSPAVSLWSKLDGVTGGGGAMAVIYRCDEAGERMEGPGGGSLSLGGAGEFVATRGWQQDVGFAEIPTDVPAIRINLRLNSAAGAAWFDDIEVFAHEQGPLLAPRPLRRGVRLSGAAIVSCQGGDELAGRIHHALGQRGVEAEVLAHDAVDFAAGDMNLHALSPTGEPRWHFECGWGVPSTLRITDGLADRRLLLAGNGLTSYAGRAWALDAAGQVVYEWWGRKSAAVQDAAAAALDGAGTPTMFCATARGDLYAWPPDQTWPNWRWVRNFTRPVRSLTVLPTQPGLIAVGADSGSLAAFDEAGEMAWHLSLGGAVTHAALVRRGGETLLAAGCRSGEVFLVTLGGTLRAWFDAEGALQDMTVADLDDDGDGEIVVATAGPDRVMVVAVD